jgi:hypothetical protein
VDEKKQIQLLNVAFQKTPKMMANVKNNNNVYYNTPSLGHVNMPES